MIRTEFDYDFRALIGKKIRALREKKGLSQAALSKLSKVSDNNIMNIELGRYSPGLDILHRLTHALGAEIEIVSKNERD